MAKMNFGGVIEEVMTREEFPLDKAREVLKDETIAVIGYGVQGPGQACNLRDNYSELRSLGYEIIGVSTDSIASHVKFISKYELPFSLIADIDKTLVEQMGVWGEKSMYGRKYMGTFRTTFIIDENGFVEKIFVPKEIKTKTHAEQILDYIKSRGIE